MSRQKVGQPKSSRRGLILIWMFAALCLLAYSIYWGILAHRIETGVRDGLAQIRGLVVADVRVNGYPYRHTVRLEQPSLETSDGLSLAAGQIQLTAYSFQPLLWQLDHIEGAQAGVSGGLRRGLAFQGLQGSLRLNPRGIERLSLITESLTAAPSRPEDRGWAIGKSQVHLVADAAEPGRYGVSLDLAGIKLSQEPEGPAAILGDQVDRVVLRGPLSEAEALGQSVKAWQSKGGHFEIMIGELTWGPLQMRDTRGKLTPDAQGRWQGDISTTGAIVPEGVPFEGLSRDVDARIENSQLSAFGLPLVRLPNAF